MSKCLVEPMDGFGLKIVLWELQRLLWGSRNKREGKIGEEEADFF